MSTCSFIEIIIPHPDAIVKTENEKLLFIRLLELSLRDQSADWSWQSPINSGRFVRAFVRFPYIPENPGDCHVASLLAMTAFTWCSKQQFIAQWASPECSGRPFAGLFVFPPVFHVPGLNHGGLGIPGFPGDRLFFFFLHGIHPGFSMPRMGETMRIQAKSFCANSSFTAPSLPGAKGLSKSASSRNSRK